jgi:hypothetical protein
MASFNEAREFSGNLFFLKAPLCATTLFGANFTGWPAIFLELLQELTSITSITKNEHRFIHYRLLFVKYSI